jgi:hypothetical protein
MNNALTTRNAVRGILADRRMAMAMCMCCCIYIVGEKAET